MSSGQQDVAVERTNAKDSLRVGETGNCREVKKKMRKKLEPFYIAGREIVVVQRASLSHSVRARENSLEVAHICI